MADKRPARSIADKLYGGAQNESEGDSERMLADALDNPDDGGEGDKSYRRAYLREAYKAGQSGGKWNEYAKAQKLGTPEGSLEGTGLELADLQYAFEAGAKARDKDAKSKDQGSSGPLNNSMYPNSGMPRPPGTGGL